MSLFTKKQPPAPDLRLEALEAEYKNYRRRTQGACETAYQDAQRKTVLAFLPLYDDLERALSAPCQDAAYRKGIELMMQNLLSILAGLKVQPMQSLGKCFNPDYHEAVPRSALCRSCRPVLRWTKRSCGTQRSSSRTDRFSAPQDRIFQVF